MPPIYLDNCATTQVLPEVAAVMAQALREGYGHPASPHHLGRQAARAIEEARATVARLIGAAPEEVFFTSGGTEANNLALMGAAKAVRGGHLIASAIEHSSVLDALEALSAEGFEVVLVPVSGSVLEEPAAVLAALRPETILVSLMQANNEVGSLLPVAEVGRLLKAARPEVLFHVDAVQAAGKLPVDAQAFRADLLSLSAHKVHGPKGVGALYVRSGTRLTPLLRGGLRERGLRPGTENVPGIVGFGAALGLAEGGEGERLAALRDQLLAGLRGVPGLVVNGPLGAGLAAQAAPHVLNVAFPGIAAMRLVEALSRRGVYVSMRSACAGHPEESHVLAAMGLPPEVRRSAIRLCLCRLNTAGEMEAAAQIIGQAVRELRA